LNGIPVFLGHQHGIGARTGNQNLLMRFGRLVQNSVKLLARLFGIQSVHALRLRSFAAPSKRARSAESRFPETLRLLHDSSVRSTNQAYTKGGCLSNKEPQSSKEPDSALPDFGVRPRSPVPSATGRSCRLGIAAQPPHEFHPRPLGGEGGSPPASSPAGASGVRGREKGTWEKGT
jgi:hypothetical protein